MLIQYFYVISKYLHRNVKKIPTLISLKAVVGLRQIIKNCTFV